MTTLIIDDEILARKRIASLLNKVDEVSVIGECGNGMEAIDAINNLQPDLVFLDINIRDMDGFQVLEQISSDKKPIVIFVTAHDDFALKAFEYEAFDYLVKPFKEERFFKTLSKVIDLKKSAQPNFDGDLRKLLENLGKKQSYLQKIPVKLTNTTVLVPVDSINYILASGVYIELFTNDKKLLYRETLNSLEQQLNPDKFVRVHRSAIVNLEAIKEIVHSDYSEMDVRMKDNHLISVSKGQKKEFLKKLGM